MRSVSLSPVGNHMAGKFSPGLMLLKWPWLGFRGFSSHFWLPLGIGIVMKVSREFWFYPRERDDLPKNRDLIDIVWLLLNKCGSDWWSYAKMSFNEWFSELLLTKHGTWSLIHMNGMIYQQLEMVISHDLYNSKKKCGDITRVQQLFHKQYPCGCVLKWCMPPNHLVYEETDDNAFNRGLKIWPWLKSCICIPTLGRIYDQIAWCDAEPRVTIIGWHQRLLVPLFWCILYIHLPSGYLT